MIYTLDVSAIATLTPEQFEALCADNPDLWKFIAPTVRSRCCRPPRISAVIRFCRVLSSISAGCGVSPFAPIW